MHLRAASWEWRCRIVKDTLREHGHHYWWICCIVLDIEAEWLSIACATDLVLFVLLIQKPWPRPSQAGARLYIMALAWPDKTQSRSPLRPSQSQGYWAKLGQNSPTSEVFSIMQMTGLCLQYDVVYITGWSRPQRKVVYCYQIELGKCLCHSNGLCHSNIYGTVCKFVCHTRTDWCMALINLIKLSLIKIVLTWST